MRTRAVVCAVAIAFVFAVVTASAPAASSSVVVTLDVASATTIDPNLCLTGSPGRTVFGSVQPDVPVVTSSDCEVAFGSTNDTASLRISQRDGSGRALFLPSDLRMDVDGFNAPSGYFSTSWSTGGPHEDYFEDVAESPDGSLVAVGRRETPTGSDLLVARFTEDGALDTAGFNAPDGWIAVAIGGTDAEGNHVEVQPDGAVVVWGDADINDPFVARFTAAGQLDTTGFASPNGYYRISTTVLEATGTLQPDGKVLLAYDATTNARVVRLTSAGVLDTATFGSGTGGSTISWGGSPDFQATGVAVDESGRIVIAGWHWASSGITTARWLSDGTPDTSWNAGVAYRHVDPMPGQNQTYNAMLRQPDGKLVLAGSVVVGDRDGYVVRLAADGTLDTAGFGGGTGAVQLDATSGAYDTLFGITYSNHDDGLVAVGITRNNLQSPNRVWKLEPDGDLDLGWGGGDGILPLATLDGAWDDEPGGVTFTGEGGIVVAASRWGGATNDDAAITRIDNAWVADYVDGATDFDQGESAFGACVRNLASGATAVWAEAGSCTATDSAVFWHGIPTTPTTIAQSPNLQDAAIVRLRFGVRAAVDQQPGSYMAPITFEVIAPAA